MYVSDTRKVQQAKRGAIYAMIPKHMAEEMGLVKGDLVSFDLEERRGLVLVIRKVKV